MPYKNTKSEIAKEKSRIRVRRRYWKNIEKSRLRSREWWRKNEAKKGHIVGQIKLPKTFAEKRFVRLKGQAKSREKDFALDFATFNSLLFSKCYYCGNEQSGTIDRIDNKLGYLKDNVVAACLRCNLMKNTMSVGDFIAHIDSIHKHLFKN